MNSLKASIYKDICLFLSLSGVLSLILPALVAAALMLGLNDAAAQERRVEPFRIAVYDRDETMMSRSLANQLRDVELFSTVTNLKRSDIEKKDASLLDAEGELIRDEKVFKSELFAGYAAVITLPYDFFYDAYTGDEKPVKVLLNGAMPLESAITAELTGSVAEILKSERAAWYAAYSLKAGGEFDTADFDEFCERAAESILDSALGRKSVLTNPNLRAELAASAKGVLFTCAASMLMLIVPAGVVKTLPDERRLSLLDRYAAAGGSFPSLILSKLIAAFILVFAALAPVVLILKPELTPASFAALFACFLAGFMLELALASLLRNTEQFMLASAALTAAALLFGGAIYPSNLMPAAAQQAGRLTPPFYLLRAVNGEQPIFKKAILPLLIMAAAGLLLFIAGEAVRRGVKRRTAGKEAEHA